MKIKISYFRINWEKFCNRILLFKVDFMNFCFIFFYNQEFNNLLFYLFISFFIFLYQIKMYYQNAQIFLFIALHFNLYNINLLTKRLQKKISSIYFIFFQEDFIKIDKYLKWKIQNLFIHIILYYQNKIIYSQRLFHIK